MSGKRASTRQPTNKLLKYTPNRESVVPIVVIRRIHIRGIDVEVVHIVTIVVSRRPEVAVGALIVRRAIVEVPGKRRRERPSGATWSNFLRAGGNVVCTWTSVQQCANWRFGFDFPITLGQGIAVCIVGHRYRLRMM